MNPTFLFSYYFYSARPIRSCHKAVESLLLSPLAMSCFLEAGDSPRNPFFLFVFLFLGGGVLSMIPTHYGFEKRRVIIGHWYI